MLEVKHFIWLPSPQQPVAVELEQFYRARLSSPCQHWVFWELGCTSWDLNCPSSLGTIFLPFSFRLTWYILYKSPTTMSYDSRFDNPASASTFPGRHLTYSYLASLNAWLLSFPSSLCCDWTMGTVALVESLADPRNLATLLLLCLIARLVWAAFIQGDPVIIMVRLCIYITLMEQRLVSFV